MLDLYDARLAYTLLSSVYVANSRQTYIYSSKTKLFLLLAVLLMI